MTGATASITQPMTAPWIPTRRSLAARLLVTLERRVMLVIDDPDRPVVELPARVFSIELVAALSLLTAEGRPIDRRRVRGQVADADQFAATVIEQMEWACHSSPGLDVSVIHDEAPVWQAFRARMETFPVPVRSTVERLPGLADDVDLYMRARRR